MAARTSTGVGIGVTITLLAVATLGLFVTTIIFFSRTQAAERRRVELEQGTLAYITDAERNQDDIRRIKDSASEGGQSVVGFLVESNGKLIERITGNNGDSVAAAEDKAVKAGADTSSLIQTLADRDRRIKQLEADVAAADGAKAAAQADLLNETKRVAIIQQGVTDTMDQLNKDLNAYKDQVDQYRDQLNEAKADMDARVDAIRQAAADTEASLRAAIADLQNDAVLDKSTIARLQADLKGQRVEGQPEYALVDGQIIGLDPTNGDVIINRGRRSKIVLGMPFEIYSDATAIRPDASGNYPSGKASVEVVKIDDTTATCRVLTEKRGNPVVKGDVIANAVYDPSKVYKFLVYGNFDFNRDGLATAQEAQEVAATIGEWGGAVTQELSGDVDFLVLGQAPVAPPQPPIDAPAESIKQYLQVRAMVQKYEELFQKAIATSIPVLNESRLYTLTGRGL